MSTASGMFVQFARSIVQVIRNTIVPLTIISLPPHPPLPHLPPLTHAPSLLLALVGRLLRTLDHLTVLLILLSLFFFRVLDVTGG